MLDEAHAEIAELNPFRYRSYYLDIETNLYYLQTRYYDPETGRFISQDDVSYLDPEHVNGLNLFAYCGNNPVMNVDPSGQIFWEIFATIALGALIGGLCSGIVSTVTGGDFVSGFVGGLVSGAIITVGMAIAFATGGIGGFAIAAFFGAGASMLGNYIQQGLSRGWDNIVLESLYISGAIGAIFGAITYGVCGFIMQNSVGLFSEVLTGSFASRLSGALSMSVESFLLTVMFSAPISIQQSMVELIVGIIQNDQEQEIKKKISKMLRRQIWTTLK